jgi:TRAP-type C4-dicarboxylate transport system permease small subunit
VPHLKKAITAVSRVFDFIYNILLVYSQVVLIVIVLIVSAQVVSRKVFGPSIYWSEEIALLLMVWTAFISLGIGVEKGLHIGIEVLFNRFPKPVQHALEKIISVVVFAFGLLMIVYGLKLISYTMTSTLPATKLPASTLDLMIPVGGFFSCYFSLFDFFGLDKYRKQPKENEDGGAMNV